MFTTIMRRALGMPVSALWADIDDDCSRAVFEISTSSHPLARLWALVLVEKSSLWRGVGFQFLETLTYIPFYAAVGWLIDGILTKASLELAEKTRWIGLYDMAILLLW